METHAVVSIGLDTIDIYDSNASHTRTQFPMPSFAPVSFARVHVHV